VDDRLPAQIGISLQSIGSKLQPLGFLDQEAERSMVRSWMKWLVAAGISLPWSASAQQACTSGIRVDGTVSDPTGAVIPGAHVRTASGEQAISDAAGHYTLSCVAASAVTVTARADGFRTASSPARRLPSTSSSPPASLTKHDRHIPSPLPESRSQAQSNPVRSARAALHLPSRSPES